MHKDMLEFHGNFHLTCTEGQLSINYLTAFGKGSKIMDRSAIDG